MCGENSIKKEYTGISQLDIVVIIGSLRKDSLTLKMSTAIKDLAPKSLCLELISIGDLPIYNEDLETEEPPIEWLRFRARVKRANGILFLTPEYNRSVPAVLKNAIDVGSAPHGHNVYDRKPVGIISLSPGSMGAFGANHHLRQSLVFLNAPAMQQPEAYIGGSERLFNKEGKLVVKSAKVFLNIFMSTFACWVKQHTLD